MKRLEEIEARVNAATPGPWEWEDTERQRWGVTAKGLVANKGDVIHADDFYLDGKERDLDFISHSREDIPFLLDNLKRVVDAARDLKAARARYGRQEFIDPLCRLFESLAALDD